jgi:DNA-binding transcriptional LysR family regulator
VKLHDYSTEEMLSGLRSGKLELALLVKPTRSMLRGFHFEPLLKDRLCLAVPPSHAYARMRSIALKKIAGESLVSLDRKDYPEVHEFMAELFAGIKAKPRIVEEHESAASIVSAVEAGTGLALVPQTLTCSFGARVKLIPIVPSPEPLIIGAAWLDKGLSANATLFMDCARKSAQTLPEYHGK